MAYCRSDGETSDVYLVKSLYGLWECYNCKLTVQSHILNTIGDVMLYLQKHGKAGHKVPIHTFERVQREIDEYGIDWNGER